MADLHRITASYMGRRFVEWDPIALNEPLTFSEAVSALTEVDAADTPPPDQKRAEQLIAADSGVTVSVKTSLDNGFSWMVARTTLAESGLRRWSLRLHSNWGGSQLLGLTRHTRATVPASMVRGNGPPNCSDAHTVNIGNFFANWFYNGAAVPVVMARLHRPHETRRLCTLIRPSQRRLHGRARR
jgi:hypothetical protein